MAPPFLTAVWRDLLMINFEIEPAVLRDLVPDGTRLDAWRGRTLVTIVGFRFLDTRVYGAPIPFHRHFDEINLRFYVRREAVDGIRRGVVFVREIVPRRAIAWVARAAYGERYVARRMRHDVQPGRHVAYEWRERGRWNRLAADVSGDPVVPPDDSNETFITEHYWGYAAPAGGTIEYRVEHPRWAVWRAVEPAFDADVTAAYGPAFAECLTRAPVSAFVATGSPVAVFRGSRLPGGKQAD